MLGYSLSGGYKKGFALLNWLRIILVAIFLTASIRLVPMPLSDTVRFGMLAIVIFAFGAKSYRINIIFLKLVLPLVMSIAVVVLIDVALGRFGLYSLHMWFKFISVLLVANTVYTFEANDLRRLLILCAGILLGQLVFLTTQPDVFAALGRDLGIRDPFVLHGRELDRIYYAYFQANEAAYTIFFMFLAWFALSRQSQIPRGQFVAVAVTFIFLASLTGGRGVILLMGAFVPAWLLLFRSTAAAMYAALFVFGGAFSWWFYKPFVGLLVMREESNIERLHAIQAYLEYIVEQPIFGKGIDWVRSNVELHGQNPSHVFVIEILATFGVIFGGAFLLILFYLLLIRQSSLSLRLIGGFGLAVGLFTNTLLTNWGFFPLLFPVLIASWNQSRNLHGYPRLPTNRLLKNPGHSRS